MTNSQVEQYVPLAACVEEFRYGTSEKSATSGRPALRIPNVIGGELNLDELKCVPVDDAEFERLRLCEGDVLFVRTNGNPDFVGRSAVFTREAVQDSGYDPSLFIFASYLIRARLNQTQMLPRFLRHYLSSPEGRKSIRERCRTSAGQFNINTAGLGTIRVPLMAIPDQHRIATILDNADAIRRKREEGIRLTEELLRSTFLEMFGDPVANERGWPRKSMAELLDNIDSGWSPKCHDRKAEGDEWAVLKLGAVTYCKYQAEENKALPESEQPQPHLEVKAGDLLMTRKNTYDLVAASAFVFETPPRLMLPDLIFRLRIKEKAPVRAEYLWGLLTHPGKRRTIQSLAGGSAGSMPNISKAKLLSQLIELPPAPLQDKFAEFMHGHHRMKSKRREVAAEQGCLFGSLVQRAFRGEL